MSPTTRALRKTNRSPLDELHAIRHRYGDDARARKLSCIRELEEAPPRSARRLAAYHEDLLFLRAFPDDAELHAAACRALSHFARRVHELAPRERRRLDDSGMAGTTTRHAFAYGIAQWLTSEGEDAELEWSKIEAPDRLDTLLRLTMAHAESDAFDSGELSTREWLELAQGEKGGSLRWLTRPHPCDVHRPNGVPVSSTIRLLYESLELPIRWRLTTARSTTGNVVEGDEVTARSAMRRIPSDPVALIRHPLPGIERLTPADAARWLAAARAALAARCREVHAISYANIDEIYRADLGEGATLIVIGAAPSDRLTLEANYGYVIFSNGVPIGYGGVTPLAAQANTGVNIFEAFRHAEGALLFVQAMRAFRTLFGVRRFIVNPFQFGAGNDEALASGAFWMYDRIGFRSVTSELRALADGERRRIAERAAYRSSIATLRKLAVSDLVLDLDDGDEIPLFDERWLVNIARAVTARLVAPDIWARIQRRDEIVGNVACTLGIADGEVVTPEMRFGVDRLAPVVALVLDDVKRWSLGERAALVQLLAAKGGAQEREFAVASRNHPTWWRALREFCLNSERRA